MSKQINIEPINFKKVVSFFKKYIFKTSFFVLISIFALFLLCYSFTDRVFSNNYVLDTMLKYNKYSRQCLYLHEDDPNLINKLGNFYNTLDNKYLVLPVFFNNMPTVLKDIQDIQLRKSVYIDILLPILLKVQKKVLNERSRLVELNSRMINEPLMEDDIAFIERLAKKYKVKVAGDDFWNYVDAVDELLLKVDVIPTSIALAISTKETGWGASRFLQEGNSLFSQWTFNEGTGIVPLARGSKKKHLVKKFKTLEESVLSFYLNVNTNSAYKRFREERRNMRLTDGTLRPRELVVFFAKYSKEKDYVDVLQNIISSNSLSKYDNYTDFSTKYKKMCLTVI